MYDFGPVGEDVHVGVPALQIDSRRKFVQGEVRHTKVRQLQSVHT
jgi:hypothetical protein